MTITVGAATSASGATDPLVVNKPASVVEGTLMLAFQYEEWMAYAALVPPAGWTTIDAASHDEGASTGGHFKTYYKVAGPSEPATYSFDHDGANSQGIVVILPLNGAEATPTLVVAKATNTTDTAPSVTPTGSTDLMVSVVATSHSAEATRTWAVVGSMTEQADVTTVWDSMAVATEQLASSSATGTRDFTPTGASTRTGHNVQVSIAVAPSAPPVQASASFGGTFAAAGIIGGAATGTAAASFGFTGTAAGVPETFGTAVAAFGGTFTANALPPYIVDVSSDGRYLVDRHGDPIMFKADTVWTLTTNAGQNGTFTWQEDIEYYAATRGGQGYNCLNVVGVANNQLATGNADGSTWDNVLPFVSGDPSNLNNSFWERLDYIFDQCAANGITVMFHAIFWDDIENGCMSTWTLTDFTNYGTSIGNRYKDRPNLIWKWADDYFGFQDSKYQATIDAIIATGDTHIHSVQNMPESTSRQTSEGTTMSLGATNSDYNYVYTYNCTYVEMERAWQEASHLPVVWGDGHYDQGSADNKLMRDLAGWALTSGARGTNYGSEAVWQWGSSARAALTTSSGSGAALRGVQDVFESIDRWWELVPDISSGFITAGRGTKATAFASGGGGGEYNNTDPQNDYVTGAKTADGELAVIYMPVATSSTITIDESDLVAGYTARWVDPTNGNSVGASAGSTYTKVGANAAGGTDWFLVLEAPTGQTGQAAAAFGFTATASGIPETFGSAVASLGFTGAASGVDRALGAALASLGFTGVAAGVPDIQGSASASFGFVATASGTVGDEPVTGVATASFGFTGTSSGTTAVLGAAVAAFGYTGSAAGVDRAVGVAAATFGYTGTAAGIDQALGVATASFGFTGTALGTSETPAVTGVAVAAFGFDGSAAGLPRVLAAAVATFGFNGTAVGVNLSIVTPPERTITVPAESRVLLAPAEDRVLVAPPENRTLEA